MFSSVLTLAFTVNQLYQDYRRDLEFIDKEWNALQEYALPVLSQSLWVLDDTLSETLVNSVARLSQVAYIAIHDPNEKLLFSAGEAPRQPGPPDRQIRLSFFDSRQQQDFPVGTLSLYTNYEHVYQNLKGRFFTTLYSQLFKTFLTSLFTLALVYFLISRHLVWIANYLDTADEPSRGKLVLARTFSNDELQQVVDTLNRYREDTGKHIQLLTQEVDARKQAEAALTMRSLLLNTMFQSVPQAALILDQKSRITQGNQCIIDRLGLTEAELTGLHIDELVHFKQVSEHHGLLEKQISQFTGQIQTARTYEGYCQFAANGTRQEGFPAILDVFPLVAQGNYLGCALIIADETSRHHMADITYHANHDYLTGAYNRYYFDRELDRILNECGADPPRSYVLGLMDLDGFKKINDVFGHAKGDEVLIQVVQALRTHFGADQLIARQGGDEFAFVVPFSLEEARARSSLMLKALGETAFYAEKMVFHVNASIGLASISSKTDTVSTAFAKADRGCYYIKGVGGGNVEVVEDQGESSPVEDQFQGFRMVDVFHQAIKQDNLLLYAQPIIPLMPQSGLVPRVEILARLGQQGELEMPANFIPALEQGRIIHLLDKSIFEKLADYIKTGRLQSQRHINVNLSPFSMHDWETRQAALKLLEVGYDHDIEITFEVTENALISHFPRIMEISRIIRSSGGHVAVDDFGKGFASYAYLEQLDVDMIKIDGSLVSRIAQDEKICAIVASIQSIANSMQAVTVAEHVDSEQARTLLRQIGINFAQSFMDGVPYPL